MSFLNEYIEERDLKLYNKVLETFKSGDDISISLIQRRCKSGYYSASRVLDELIINKKVSTPKLPTTINKMI